MGKVFAHTLLPQGPDVWKAFPLDVLVQLRAVCIADAKFFRNLLQDALLARLDEDGPNQASVLFRAIVRLSVSGDKILLSAVARRILHDQPWTRTCATQALSDLVRHGNAAEVAAILVDYVHHECPDTRCRAYHVLQECAKCGDAGTTLALVHGIGDHDPSVRRAVINTFADLVGRSHATQLATVIPAVAEYLEHPDGGVRDTALSALVCIMSVVDSAIVIDAVVSRLDHVSPSVRHSAATGLELIASSGDFQVVEAVAALADHTDPDVRCCALRLLHSVASPGQAPAVMAALGHLEDDDGQVSLAAKSLLAQIGTACSNSGRRPRTRVAA